MKNGAPIKTIKVDTATHGRLRLIAAATGSTIAETVKDLAAMSHARLVRLNKLAKETK